MIFLHVTNAHTGRVIRLNPRFIIRYCELSKDSEHRAKGAETVMVVSEGEMPEHWYIKQSTSEIDYLLETRVKT